MLEENKTAENYLQDMVLEGNVLDAIYYNYDLEHLQNSTHSEVLCAFAKRGLYIDRIIESGDVFAISILIRKGYVVASKFLSGYPALILAAVIDSGYINDSLRNNGNVFIQRALARQGIVNDNTLNSEDDQTLLELAKYPKSWEILKNNSSDGVRKEVAKYSDINMDDDPSRLVSDMSKRKMTLLQDKNNTLDIPTLNELSDIIIDRKDKRHLARLIHYTKNINVIKRLIENGYVTQRFATDIDDIEIKKLVIQDGQFIDLLRYTHEEELLKALLGKGIITNYMKEYNNSEIQKLVKLVQYQIDHEPNA